MLTAVIHRSKAVATALALCALALVPILAFGILSKAKTSQLPSGGRTVASMDLRLAKAIAKNVE